MKLLGTFRMDTGTQTVEEKELCSQVMEFEQVAITAQTGDLSCYVNFGHMLYNLAIPMFLHLVACLASNSSPTFYLRDLGLASRSLPGLLPQLDIKFAEWVPQCCGDICPQMDPLPPAPEIHLIHFYAVSAQYVMRRAADSEFLAPFRQVVTGFLAPTFQRVLRLSGEWWPYEAPAHLITYAHRAEAEWVPDDPIPHGEGRRSLQNAREVAWRLQRFAREHGFGFMLVDFKPQTLLEDARRMHHTHVLVGQHGAGLHNCLFMRPGSLVVELSRAWRLGYRSIFWCSTACTVLRNIRYYGFEEDAWATNFTGEYPVDVNGLERFLTRHILRPHHQVCFPEGAGFTFDFCCSRLHGERGNNFCWGNELTYEFCC